MAQEGDPDAAIGRTDRSAIHLPSLDVVEAVARKTEQDLDDLPKQMLTSSVIAQFDVLRAWTATQSVDDAWGRAALSTLLSLADGFLRVDGLDLLGEEILEMLERAGILGQAE